MPKQPWADCRETHLSAVFMAGEFVLKVKKPVQTDFVDFTQLAARDRACEEEVRLNSRLSPDVYLGVARVGLRDEGPGEPVVVMRRLSDGDRLSERIARSRASAGQDVRDVARALVAFHASCEPQRDPCGPGGWASVRHAWVRECAQLDALGDDIADSVARTLIRERGLAFLDNCRPLFDARSHEGWVREGHGDLRCEHIYLTTSGVRILDCVEFDANLRVSDVLSDLAFLVMDLERLGAAGWARSLLTQYAELSAMAWPASLLDFYVAYRALVRAKVCAVRARQTGEVDRGIRRYIEIAVAHLGQTVRALVLVGGLPGSGKSTVCATHAEHTGAIHISSDEIRRGLHPRPPGEATVDSPWNKGSYAPSATDRVYAELLSRARTVLGEGGSVVLDASWRDAGHRARAHAIACDEGAVAVDVRCVVDDRVADERLSRDRSGDSQAGMKTRSAVSREFDEWPDAVTIDTDGTAFETAVDLDRLVNERRALAGR
jgi:uncharacterized protein